MRTLYHFPLCPFSRKLRVVLKEKQLPFELMVENFWERRDDFLKRNPAAQVPILVDEDQKILCDSQATIEYIEETNADALKLMGRTPQERQEIRRLVNWFDVKFYNEVTRHILYEKIIKFYSSRTQPQSEAIRAAKANVVYHLDYIAFLTRSRKWLAGEHLTLADIAAAAQLSVLDYLGDVPWQHNVQAKEWYAIMKSRPSFRPLLSDRIPGFSPVSYYNNPDF